MKIRLIEPEPPGHARVVQGPAAAPRAAHHRAPRSRQHGHDVLIYSPQMAPIDWDDVLLAPTSSASPAPRRRRRPPTSSPTSCARAACPVVIGGSHVTFMADEALAHADYVARGEGGEQLMLELIEALAGRRASSTTIAGLSFTARRRRRAQRAARAAAPTSTSCPFPDLTLIVGREQAHDVMPIMTSWGCPFACNFCSVTAMFGRKYRFRSAESVIAELKDKQPQRIFFYDDNMAADKQAAQDAAAADDRRGPRDPVVGAGAHRRRPRPRAPRPHARSGCDRVVYLGLESVSQETLDELREVADRRRHRARHQGAARVRHQEPRHVRARRRQRHRADGPRHRRASPSRTTSTR